MSTFAAPSLLGINAPLSGPPEAMLQAYGTGPLRTDGELLALGYAADGTLWSVEEPGLLRHWSIADAKQLSAVGLEDLATLWTFSKDCHWVACGSDEATVWEVATGRLAATFRTPAWITALSFSDDQQTMATGHDDGKIGLWDVAEHRLLRDLEGHETAISALAFSPDGKTLASAGEDKLIHLWDVATGALRDVTMHHNDRIPELLWHPTKPQLISAGWDTTARVWDTATGEPVILLNSHAPQVHKIALAADGRHLLCADSDQSLHLWDLEQFKTIRIWPNQGAEIRALTFAPRCDGFALGGADRVIRVVRLEDEAPASSEIDPRSGRAHVAVAPDGERLVHLSMHQETRFWNVKTAQPIGQLQEAEKVLALTASTDGKWIAASLVTESSAGKAPPSLHLWDAVTGARRATLDGPAPPVTALSFSNDSKLLASASYASSDVWIWDVDKTEPLLLISDVVEGCSVEALAFMPDSRILAVAAIDWLATGGSNGAISFWDVVQSKEIQRLTGGNLALSFSPSGKQLVSATLDRTLQVWETATGNLIDELEGHADQVNCLAHDPNGRYFASGGDDFVLCTWDAETHELLADTRLDTQPKAVCFSSDSQFLFVSNGNGSCYKLSVEKILVP